MKQLAIQTLELIGKFAEMLYFVILNIVLTFILTIPLFGTGILVVGISDFKMSNEFVKGIMVVHFIVSCLFWFWVLA